uniref:Uncharacterized protein n=1 Tax=Sphaerodactylus townsendi TaxID=933632 RepID=A0ACB8FAU7_9SAUR
MLIIGGANLVSCGAAGYVRFWNIRRSQLLGEFEAHGGMGSIIMTIDKASQYLITGDLAGWVKIWNIEVSGLVSFAAIYQEYCLSSGDNMVTTQLPPLVRSFQPHEDGVTSLETCRQNSFLFILSSSTDCSVVLSDIAGVPFGTFGQEGHWRIGNYAPSFPRGENKDQTEEGNDIKENGSDSVPFVEEETLPNLVEQNVPVAEDKEDLAYTMNVWDNTILGKKYKEKHNWKGRKYTLCSKTPVIKPAVVYRSLNIEALKETTEMKKLDFLLHPDKYFGEKSGEKCWEDLKQPTLSASK